MANCDAMEVSGPKRVVQVSEQSGAFDITSNSQGRQARKGEAGVEHIVKFSDVGRKPSRSVEVDKLEASNKL
ncbi:hypothetical protein Tdes44962_MAKER05181 [Teratosphaeria destructans]|uniref:Uncharacterized protein n=1 Tax=Teratosphaeria destructans TaxID=418781 RepID=A0A9W7SKL6_9PEZI|nr:hypothetical protein Tdes44962_MAKER05181 [Teratosphaeria destructans]